MSGHRDLRAFRRIRYEFLPGKTEQLHTPGIHLDNTALFILNNQGIPGAFKEELCKSGLT